MSVRTETAPLYRVLADRIGDAIGAGTLEHGLVLLEGQLSDVLGASRATVRNALTILADDGHIAKFDGRGFIVKGAAEIGSPIRRRVKADDIPQSAGDAIDMQPASDQIIAEVSEAVSIAVAFGHYRINEQGLADAYAVSRPTAREVLWRLRELKLVEKDMHSPWLVGPLTARAVSEDCELHILLEPHALGISAKHLQPTDLEEMRQSIAEARSTSGRIDPMFIGRLEEDLHQRCLKNFPNRRILELLRKGAMTSRVDILFARYVGIDADAAGLAEHEAILENIATGDLETACALHARHLEAEGKRTLKRLKVLSVIKEPPLPDYFERVA